MEDDMNKLYRKEIAYLAEKCKDVAVLKRVYTILYTSQMN